MLSNGITGLDVAALDAAAKEAIQWEVRLRNGTLPDRELKEFEAWKAARSANADAWERLQARLARLRGLRGTSAQAVRQALDEPSHTRRRVLKIGAGLATLAGVGVATRQLVRSYGLDADYRNPGVAAERVALADGVPVTLGASARVYRDDDGSSQSDIFLASGPIIAEARGTAAKAMSISTRYGMVRAERARVGVDSLKFHTVVAVQGGDALLYTRGGSSVRIQDGSAWSLRGGEVAQMPESAPDVFAWEHGALVVINRPVPDLVETLSRYFGGYIHFPQTALAHNVSGVFMLTDAKASIKQLASTLGLSVNFYGQGLAVAV